MTLFNPCESSFSPEHFGEECFKAESRVVSSNGEDKRSLDFLVAYRTSHHRMDCDAARIASAVMEVVASRYRSSDDFERLIAVRTIWSAGLFALRETMAASLEIYIEALSDAAFAVREQAAYALFFGVREGGEERAMMLAAADRIRGPLTEIIRFESEVIGVIEEAGAADYASGVLRAITPDGANLFLGYGRHIKLAGVRRM